MENLQKRYEKSLEDWPVATEDIKEPYSNMHTELEAYIGAIQKAAFCYGYQCALADRKETLEHDM